MITRVIVIQISAAHDVNVRRYPLHSKLWKCEGMFWPKYGSMRNLKSNRKMSSNNIIWRRRELDKAVRHGKYGFSYVYVHWYAYLELGLFQFNTTSGCSNVEYSRGSSNTISVLPKLISYSTYWHIVSMIIRIFNPRDKEVRNFLYNVFAPLTSYFSNFQI